MKRARPRNKKAELKKQKKEEKLKIKEEKREEKLRIKEEKSPKPEKPKKTKKKKGKVFFTVLAIVLVILFALMGFGLFDGGDILAPVEGGKVNVLLLGVDEEGLRTDTIMIASYDVNASCVNLLSIPRDTKVYLKNRRATKKINGIHAMTSKKDSREILGAEATAEAVTKLTGIPINYYAEFSFSSIDRLFDILGPVKFDVPDVEGKGRGMNYDDPYQNLHIHLKPGEQELSGNQIQQFLRYRKSNYGVGTGSDTDRVIRQQELLKAVVAQKVNVGTLINVPNILAQLSREIRTNIQTGDITKYIRYIAKLSGESITAYTLPGENKMIGGASYFVVYPDEATEIIKQVFGYEGPVTDEFSISDEYSQKVIKAGNMQKKSKEPVKTAVPKKTDTQKNTQVPVATKTPLATKTPTNTPAPTKKPTATNTPLEELDGDSISID